MLSNKCKDAIITALLTETSLSNPYRESFLDYIATMLVGTTIKLPFMMSELLGLTDIDWTLGEKLGLYTCCGCGTWSYEIAPDGYCPECSGGK